MTSEGQMFRPADKMEEDTEMSEAELSSWPDLEPELLSTISACLKKHDQGTMRLVCKAWKTAVDDGLQNLTVTRKIVEDQLRDLATLFPRLKHLDLSGYAWLTDSEFAGLKDLSMLRDFKLIFGHELSVVGAQQFQYLTKLEKLRLINFMRLDDSNIQSMKPLVNLTELTLQGSPRVTDEGAKCLTSLRGLQILSISYMSRISDGCYRTIAKLNKLHTLTLSGNSEIQGHGLSQLKCLENLSKLDLSRTGLTDAAISEIRSLTQIQHLNLAHCDLSDKALWGLKDLYLKSLDITKCQRITGKGIGYLSYIDRVISTNGATYRDLQPNELLQCILAGPGRPEQDGDVFMTDPLMPEVTT